MALPFSYVRAAGAPHLAPFPEGTRYLSLGDSITGGGLYHSYAHLFHITRYPTRSLEWINAGVSGDSASGALQRLSWDVFPAEPDVVSIKFGMNDVGGFLYRDVQEGPEIEARREDHINRLENNLREIIQTLQKQGIQVVLITPSIFDETAKLESANNPGRNSALAESSARVKRLGEEFNLPVVDFFSPMLKINLQNQETDPSFTLTSRDRVHPGAEGHFVMAYQLLTAQQAEGVVARVEIDAAAGSMTASENCSVDQLQLTEKTISFNYLAQALPFPVDKAAQRALEWVPFTEELNQELLIVSGLSEGMYLLQIDSTPIRTFSAREFQRGINLADEIDTPQYRQALHVQDLFNQRRALVSKIRAIAFVEHGTSRELPRPLSLEQVTPHLDAWVERSLGMPYEGFFRLSARNYLESKPIEDDILLKIENLLPQIQKAAIPVTRTITITLSEEEDPI